MDTFLSLSHVGEFRNAICIKIMIWASHVSFSDFFKICNTTSVFQKSPRLYWKKQEMLIVKKYRKHYLYPSKVYLSQKSPIHQKFIFCCCFWIASSFSNSHSSLIIENIKKGSLPVFRSISTTTSQIVFPNSFSQIFLLNFILDKTFICYLGLWTSYSLPDLYKKDSRLWLFWRTRAPFIWIHIKCQNGTNV